MKEDYNPNAGGGKLNTIQMKENVTGSGVRCISDIFHASSISYAYNSIIQFTFQVNNK
jgi:hypothetical protein